jgi:hypothetical protein
MKKMIFWLKFCAALLTIMLIVHSLEIVYDILYHGDPAGIFTKHS